MVAIIKRELSSYFSSPVGYIYLAVFYLFSGYFFWTGCLLNGSSNIRAVFSSLFTVIMFIVPLITMRLFSEERKQKTDQILLTAPISLFALVAGKFLAAFVVYALGLSVTLIYALVISSFAAFNWAVFLNAFLGMLLMGAALISIGMFMSSLTESQIVAAILSFIINLALILIDTLAIIIPVEFISKILTGISFYSRYSDFSLGMLNFANIIFFISVVAVFIFLTIRVHEKRRWS